MRGYDLADLFYFRAYGADPDRTPFSAQYRFARPTAATAPILRVRSLQREHNPGVRRQSYPGIEAFSITGKQVKVSSLMA